MTSKIRQMLHNIHSKQCLEGVLKTNFFSLSYQRRLSWKLCVFGQESLFDLQLVIEKCMHHLKIAVNVCSSSLPSKIRLRSQPNGRIYAKSS